MDPFSHVAFGRTLAALHTPRVRARGTIPAVVLGALAPDADAVLMPFGWDIYLRAHEVGTHSALGSLAIAALTALVVRVSVRGSRYPALVAAAWAGGLSHLALDCYWTPELSPHTPECATACAMVSWPAAVGWPSEETGNTASP